MHKGKNCRECTDILKKGHQFKISSQVCLWGIICTTIKIYESPSIVLVELTAFYLVLQSSTSSTILHCKYILLSKYAKSAVKSQSFGLEAYFHFLFSSKLVPNFKPAKLKNFLVETETDFRLINNLKCKKTKLLYFLLILGFEKIGCRFKTRPSSKTSIIANPNFQLLLLLMAGIFIYIGL